jgi:hypothetical protein
MMAILINLWKTREIPGEIITKVDAPLYDLFNCL